MIKTYFNKFIQENAIVSALSTKKAIGLDAWCDNELMFFLRRTEKGDIYLRCPKIYIHVFDLYKLRF